MSALTTYGPAVLARLTSSEAEIGLLIGGEGAFALALPVVVGVLSDRLPASPLGRRLPFVLAGAPLLCAAIALLPFVPDYALAGAVIAGFFVGYFLYYPPYRALYADLVPRDHYGRAQSGQALARGLGLGAALLAGGLLLDVWRALPFVLAAAAVAGTTLVLLRLVRRNGLAGASPLPSGTEAFAGSLWRRGDLRSYAVANGLWEFSFAGLRSFIVLYVVRGLGHSASVASAVIAVVAVAYIVAAPLAGALADRLGIFRVISVSALVYGCGLVLGVLPHTLAPMLAGLPFVALAGAVLMTLPTALALTVSPPGREGAVAGLQDLSRGLGIVCGPILVGVAIDASKDLLPATHGFAAMWVVIGLPILASLPFVRALERATPRERLP